MSNDTAVRTAAARRIGLCVRASRRRGSVLVLVMTILSVLFVIGVAFLATMNFEADTIAAERVTRRNREGVRNITADLTQPLREALVAPLFTGSLSGDPSTFAAGVDLPGWHNLAAPIEPEWTNPLTPMKVYNPNTGDGSDFRWGWSTDLRALLNTPFTGPSIPRIIPIKPSIPHGQGVCLDVGRVGLPCSTDDGICTTCIDDGSEFVNLNLGSHVDADGDGVSDAISFDARTLQLPEEVVERLSLAVNGRPDGKVTIGLRIIPHGGLVNLNDAHPYTIASLFGFDPYHDDNGDLVYEPAATEWQPRAEDLYLDAPVFDFRHLPTQLGAAHAVSVEEPLLRRRGGLIAPRNISSSALLFGLDINGDGVIDTGMTRELLAKDETTLPSGHRYWGFDFLEQLGPDTTDPMHWATRMSATYALRGLVETNAIPEPPATLAQKQTYRTVLPLDRRHLATTVSHDDTFHRGGIVQQGGADVSVRAAMLAVNNLFDDPNAGACDPDIDATMRFQLPMYPDGPFLDPVCDCGTDPGCPLSPTSGLLKLSLPYLDTLDAAAAAEAALGTPDGDAAAADILEIREDLIYEFFWMLVSNAAGPYWDGTSADGTCDLADPNACQPGPFVCRDHDGDGLDPICIDPFLSDRDDPLRIMTRRESLVTRTAASLTANLLDFVDIDSIPTRVAIRDFRFDSPFAGTSQLDTTPGRVEYVYGLERQPYITEVVSAHDGEGPALARAIEIVNPYAFADGTTNDIIGDNSDGWYLYEVDPTALSPIADARGRRIALSADGTTAFTSGADPYTVFKTLGGDALFEPDLVDPGAVDAPVATPLMFKPGWRLLLVRAVDYDGIPGLPSDEIVVDEFLIPPGSNVGSDAPSAVGAMGQTTFDIKRVVKDDAPWTGLVPWASEDLGQFIGHTLNAENELDPAAVPHVRPVEANFANTGTFCDPSLMTEDDPPLITESSLPTTGSLLLLMRHANRPLPRDAAAELIDQTQDLAFTSWLNHSVELDLDMDMNPDGALFERAQPDNGRMPIFDSTSMLGLAAPHNRVDGFGRQAAHHLRTDDATTSPVNTPGSVNTLPWGQLVYDYFTALPLFGEEARGPYAVNLPLVGEWDGNPSSGFPFRENATPRIDMNGARVHGRIDLNSAPWRVLQGVRLIPIRRFPRAFSAKIATSLGFNAFTEWPPSDPGFPTPTSFSLLGPDISKELGAPLAQAIVAYREARRIAYTDPLTGGHDTGNYGDPAAALTRAWDAPSPTVRRGTGFLTVGELANVRHPNAIAPNFRIDGADGTPQVNADGSPGGDFISAAAVLLALPDWVTVRSHVYTVYGVVRGEADPDLDASPEKQRRDLDGRTIRFQQTIDRMPMLLGAGEPESVTPEIIERYNDVVNN